MTAPIELSPLKAPVLLGSIKDFRLVLTCVGWNSEAIRMFVPEEAADAVFGTTKNPQGASFPKTHTEQNYVARICVSSSEETWVCDLPLVTATFPIVQTLPGGDILVVAPRCSRNQDGTHEYNARVYDRIGALAAEFCLGMVLSTFRQTMPETSGSAISMKACSGTSAGASRMVLRQSVGLDWFGLIGAARKYGSTSYLTELIQFAIAML